jgi:NAD(P)H dehydrogenase (quinone)
VIELGRPVSSDEIADAIGEALGREVKAQAIPREAWAKAMEQMGLPAGSTWAYEELMDGVNTGWIDFGVEGTEKRPGTTTAREVFAQAIQR